MGTPSKNFLEAAKKWNAGKTEGTIVPKPDKVPIEIYDQSFNSVGIIGNFPNTTLIRKYTISHNNINYLYAEVMLGVRRGKIGYVKVDDLQDIGDGKDTVKLSIVEVKKVAIEKLELFVDFPNKQNKIDLPKNTRVKIIANQGTSEKKIQVVDGKYTGKIGTILLESPQQYLVDE